MKISNSKKQLAKIIHDNGGWRDGAEWAAQDKDWRVSYFDGSEKPVRPAGKEEWWAKWYIRLARIKAEKLLTNWHSVLISRDEYLHMHPVAEATPEPVSDAKPTIEQLAADYRNLLDFARRKQEEADDAKADADEALRKLELAGEEIGFVVTPITAKQDSELVSVKVGDEVECIKSNVNPSKYMGMIGTILEVDDSSTPYLVDFGGEKRIWCHEVKLIRRP